MAEQCEGSIVLEQPIKQGARKGKEFHIEGPGTFSRAQVYFVNGYVLSAIVTSEAKKDLSRRGWKNFLRRLNSRTPSSLAGREEAEVLIKLSRLSAGGMQIRRGGGSANGACGVQDERAWCVYLSGESQKLIGAIESLKGSPATP